MNYNASQNGFTVIEILVVMGIISILAAVTLVALNPGRHFAQARNTQRSSNVTALLNAVSQNIIDNHGVFTCGSLTLPASFTKIKNGSSGFDIAACLIPTYISTLPTDPSATGAHFTDNLDYDTGYELKQDPSTGRITVNAPATELGGAPITAVR